MESTPGHDRVIVYQPQRNEEHRISILATVGHNKWGDIQKDQYDYIQGI